MVPGLTCSKKKKKKKGRSTTEDNPLSLYKLKHFIEPLTC